MGHLEGISMGSVDRFRRGLVALAVFASTALMLFYGDGLMPLWPLMWLAPVPVLWFALSKPAWQAGVMAGAVWMAGALNLWSYLHILHAPRILWFLDFGLEAVAFSAGVLLMRTLERREEIWSAWIALPAVWVTFEFVRNLLWTNGSAGCVAYSQLNFLPFLQFASVAGPWGMGFVLMLFPAGLALAMHRWGSARRQAVCVLGATTGIVAAVLIFGAARMEIPQPGPSVKVGLIASDANGGASIDEPGASTQHLFEHYAERARELIARGARAVVMPEDMGLVPDADVAKVGAIFQPIADHSGAVLVVGMARMGATGRHNEARIYTPDGAVRTYYKEHLLPPFETSHFAPGKKQTKFTAPGSAGEQAWGAAICKDMDFTNPSRSYGRAGVGLMLVPAWDFRVDGLWHGHIAVMRAVEDGFSLARSARDGLLTVADDRGRIVAETASSSAPFATLVAEVPTGHSETVFLLLGNWFGWLSIVIAGFAVVEAVRLQRRSDPERTA